MIALNRFWFRVDSVKEHNATLNNQVTIKKATSILLMARWFAKIVTNKTYLRGPRRGTLPEHQMTNVKIIPANLGFHCD